MIPGNREGEFDMLAKTMYGLEDILHKELEDLGAKSIVPGRRMVAFRGDKQLLYKANIHLRTALRILVPVAQFEANNPDEVYQYLNEHITWENYMTPRNSFAIDAVVYSDLFTHSKFVTYRAKDAIADYFQDREGRRPNVSVSTPDLLFHIHIADKVVTLALDSSGESLHKRGYRAVQNDAPISEVLAAGILLRSGWRGETPLLDPMCGSGTFLIEAALIALNIPPGIFRDEYAFERWKDFDQELLSELLDDWEERSFEHKIYGSDNFPKAIAIARSNIKQAGVQKVIELSLKPFEEYTVENRPADKGIIVMNPPYGERMRPDDLTQLYTLIGSTLKHSFMGWQAFIFTGNVAEGFEAIGLKHFLREKLYNGAIECELRAFELFEGKRSQYLEQLSDEEIEANREKRIRYREEREVFNEKRKSYYRQTREPLLERRHTSTKRADRPDAKSNRRPTFKPRATHERQPK